MSKASENEPLGDRCALSYPPAMYAADILADPAFAAALGYGWLHEADTEFARAFRAQVQRQADLYEQWLSDRTPLTAD